MTSFHNRLAAFFFWAIMLTLKVTHVNALKGISATILLAFKLTLVCWVRKNFWEFLMKCHQQHVSELQIFLSISCRFWRGFVVELNVTFLFLTILLTGKKMFSIEVKVSKYSDKWTAMIKLTTVGNFWESQGKR